MLYSERCVNQMAMYRACFASPTQHIGYVCHNIMQYKFKSEHSSNGMSENTEMQRNVHRMVMGERNL